MIRTVFWENDSVRMIDQKALPGAEKIITYKDYRKVAGAIRDLTVRGAPAIGVAAALGIALGTLRSPAPDRRRLRADFNRICREFAGTRPTARNLFWAIERMKRRFADLLGDKGLGLEAVRWGLVEEAIRIGEEDIEANRRMGAYGKGFVPEGGGVLTHCNAGALATAGYGTALGVLRAAWAEGKRFHVFVDETRPVLQGARLTCWELIKEKIPATLITDSMAGALMAQGRINAVFVGADRIAANGDTANKIGTYSLAVLARAHKIPFYVAAPLSTVDLSLLSGKDIPIEMRHASEVTGFAKARTAPEGIGVFNPAFDVTPSRYISAIITDRGVAKKPFSRSLPRLVNLTGLPG